MRTPQRIAIIATAVCMVLAAVLVVNVATVDAQANGVFSEDFESFSAGAIAQSAWYSTTDSSEPSANLASSLLVQSSTLTGSTRALAWNEGTINSFGHIIATDSHIRLCNLNSKLDLDIYLPSLTSSAHTTFLHVRTGGLFPAFQDKNSYASPELDTVGFKITGGASGLASVMATLSNSGASSMGTVQTPGLFHATLTNVFCTTSATKFTYVFGSLATSIQINSQLVSATKDIFISNIGGTAAGTFLLDNIVWTGMGGANPYGANLENFNSFVFGATPSGSAYTFTTVQGTGAQYTGVLDCDGISQIPADTGSKCSQNNAGSTQTLHSLVGGFCPLQSGNILTPYLVTDFSLGGGGYQASPVQTLTIQAPSSTMDRIVLTAGFDSSNNHYTSVLVVANGATVINAAGPFNQFFDRLYIGCNSSTIAVSFESGKVLTGTGAFSAAVTDIVQGPSNQGQSIDNVNFAPTGPTAGSTPTVGAAASVAVTNLASASVASDGSGVIARHTLSSGSVIKTYAGQSLAVNPTTAISCNILDGVLAIPGYVSYADCNADPTGNSVDRIRIRSPNLDNPAFPNTCHASSGQTYCDADPGHEISVTVPPALSQLGILSSSNFDFTASADGGVVCCKSTLLSWTFADGLGNVGVFADLQTSVGDTSQSVITNVNPAGQPVVQICGFSNHAGRQGATTNLDLLGVADTSVAGQLFSVSSTRGTTNPVLTISRLYTLGAFQKTTSVGCGENHIMFTTSNGATGIVGVVQATPSGQQSLLWQKTLAGGGINRGAALSQNGQCGVYVTGTTANVVNATTGLPIFTATLPTGTFRSVALTQKCQSLYAFTSDFILRYDIHAGFNGGNYSSEDGGQPNNNAGKPTTTSSPGSDPATTALSTTGCGAFGGMVDCDAAWLTGLGIVTIAVFAFAGWFLTGGRIRRAGGGVDLIPGNTPFTAGAAYTGLIVDWMAWGWPFIVALLIAIVAIVLVYLGRKQYRGSGAS